MEEIEILRLPQMFYTIQERQNGRVTFLQEWFAPNSRLGPQRRGQIVEMDEAQFDCMCAVMHWLPATPENMQGLEKGEPK